MLTVSPRQDKTRFSATNGACPNGESVNKNGCPKSGKRRQDQHGGVDACAPIRARGQGHYFARTFDGNEKEIGGQPEHKHRDRRGDESNYRVRRALTLATRGLGACDDKHKKTCRRARDSTLAVKSTATGQMQTGDCRLWGSIR